jgi:hypothetical protein
MLFVGALLTFLLALWLSERALRAHRELSRKTWDPGS